MKNTLRLIFLLLIYISGCARVSRELAAPWHEPLPRDAGAAFQMMYYETHAIQNVRGQLVTVNGKVFKAENKKNGLGYIEDRNRAIVYEPPYSVSGARGLTFYLLPAATLVGAAAGSLFTLRNFYYNDWELQQNAKGGAMIGLGASLCASAILYFLIPSMVQSSAEKAALRYNNRLWYNLDLIPMPSDPNVLMRLHLKF